MTSHESARQNAHDSFDRFLNGYILVSRDRGSRSLSAAAPRSEAPGLVHFVGPAPELHLDLTRLAVAHDLQLDRRAGPAGRRSRSKRGWFGKPERTHFSW